LDNHRWGDSIGAASWAGPYRFGCRNLYRDSDRQQRLPGYHFEHPDVFKCQSGTANHHHEVATVNHNEN